MSSAVRADADAGGLPGQLLDGGPDAGAIVNPDLASPASAENGTPTATAAPIPEDETPAYLRAGVNQVDIGDVFVILKGRDVLIKVTDLEKPGLEARGGVRMKRADDMMISLQSLAPLVTLRPGQFSVPPSLRSDRLADHCVAGRGQLGCGERWPQSGLAPARG